MPFTDLSEALATSRYAQRLIGSEPALHEELRARLHEPVDALALARMWEELAHLPDRALALRRLKKRAYLRLMARDLMGLADLDEVLGGFSALAETSIALALPVLAAELTEIYGTPLGEASGRPQSLIVVAMGKLGGGELNASSDIDLVYVYPEEGETGGPRRISNHEFFTRLGQRLTRMMSELTPEGYVFRVDTRLRPWGESGPLVVSLPALEDYFLVHGRAWERYAWLKARALTGDAQALDAVVRPFVYRRYLDYDALAALRALHAQIRAEVARRDRADDIKLGPGGIREIEFIAQVFQLIRGGRDPGLTVRGTRAALATIAQRGLLPAATVAELEDAYAFLRRLEHRLQYLDDAQTQRLPKSEEDRAKIARAMDRADWPAFESSLEEVKARVTRHFEGVFGAAEPARESPESLLWTGLLTEEDALAWLSAQGFDDPKQALERLVRTRSSSRYRRLDETARHRFDRLVPQTLKMAARAPRPTVTLARMLDLLEAIASRSSYLALLTEYPHALEHVARLVSASPWAAEYLRSHPVLLDELIYPDVLFSRPDWAEERQRLHDLLGEVLDTERQMDVLRHFKHALTLRILAQDVEGLLPIEELADLLTAIADIVLVEVLRLAWMATPRRHRELPAFAIVGYGKLGSREMGYASDLDLVFLYDDPAPEAPELYARLAARINTWLTTLTPAGVLYETDLRLRPEGVSGLLVSSAAAFRSYQENNAWVWEHQALTRARAVAGDPAVCAGFEALRRDILCRPREPQTLAREVLAMRAKILAAHPNDSGLFDVKHDRGGLIDVEFMVQYLVLAHAHAHPELADNAGNIALLRRAGGLKLIPAASAERVALAYRHLRRLQHARRMAGETYARVHRHEVEDDIAAVLTLWQTLFGSVAESPLE